MNRLAMPSPDWRGASPVLPERRAAPTDQTAFREAMAGLAGGVAIVACLDEGAPRGLLVSSLIALSVEPPRVLFCVRKAAGCHDALLRADRCSIAILGEEDREEASRFAETARAAERFTSADWRMDGAQPPVYRNALVSLSGAIDQRHDAGANSVFILDIHTTTRRAAAPLVYFDRSFRGLRD